MKKIKVAYPKIMNMGDLLNELVIEKIFNLRIESVNVSKADLSAIGSSLGLFTYTKEDSLKCILKKTIEFIQKPTVYVWGTGFMYYNNNETKFYKRVLIKAVRGNLSKKRAEKLLNKKLDIVVGDPGLLSSYLISNKIEKKYSIGIIPHFREQDEPIFQELANYYANSLFIDVKQSPETVIKQISQCEVILSSSLHGLIISDSLHIPNFHIKVTNKLVGDGFKFDDYYSAFNMEHNFIDLNKDKFPSLDWIKDNYKVEKEKVEKIKKDLISAFPYAKK